MNIKYEANLRPNLINEAGDAIATTGTETGKSFDVMGTPQIAFKSNRWIHQYDDSCEQLINSIDGHFLKIASPKSGLPALDKLILDLKNYDEFNPKLRIDILNHINNPNYVYKDLVNSIHFEIIN
ncbi:hypothetical protein [Pedobacter sp. NJ-S-72]